MKIKLHSTNLLLLFGIVVLINLISAYIYFRFDFTKGRIYSISRGTKKIVKQLKRPLYIYPYFTKNLPLEYQVRRKYLEDILKEYRTLSHGNIRFKFIDPSESPEEMRKCTSYGIPPIRFTVIRRDKYEMQEGFMGVAFLYGDKTEVIPVVKDITALEYDITSRIKKLTTETKKEIAFTAGHDELNINDLREVNEMLRLNYTINHINPNEEDFPPTTSAVVILGPRRKFTDEALFRIDQAVLSGIPVGFMTDLNSIDQQTFMVRKLNLGLEKLLEHYGVKIKPGFVLDMQNQQIVVRTAQAFFVIENIVRYPFFPIITNIKKDNPIAKDFDQITLTYISPIELNLSEKQNGEILLKSTDKAWYKEDVFTVSPFASDIYPARKDFKQYNLMAIVQGEFNSYFADKPPKGKEQLIKKTGTSRILVLPCSGFVRNEPTLFMNIIDWLVADEDLISIRTKNIVMPQIPPLPSGVRFAYKHFMIFAPPVGVFAFGLIRWQIKLRKRKLLKTIISEK